MRKSHQQPVIQDPKNHRANQYRLGVRFDPGAMAEVFEPLTGLPLLSFRGLGRVAGEMRVTQFPQVWFNPQRGIVGLGGIQSGQMIQQPLLDPSQQNS